ncbi:MAG TPA: DUF3800 domain-containing protein [Acidobacteriota bacterium]|nr:DUF3800 domain-containing protein [Acidobacteriota bacterium]
MTKYRLYIDEVGNSDVNSSDNPNHRFLSLTGVIISLEYVSETLNSDMEEFKKKHVGSHPDEPVILHRKEIMNALDDFRVLADPQKRAEFDDDLVSLLKRWQYTLLTVCLDKKNHKDTYSTWIYDPYHYCLAVLLERYNYWLNRHSCHGDVMAESRGGKADMRLKNSFNNLWNKGTDYVGADQFQKSLTSSQLKVKMKTANISGLQLADLLAFPCRAQILAEQGYLGKEYERFTKRILPIIEEKYDKREGKIYGKKFI